jgi:hypothetical protein
MREWPCFDSRRTASLEHREGLLAITGHVVANPEWGRSLWITYAWAILHYLIHDPAGQRTRRVGTPLHKASAVKLLRRKVKLS